MKKKILVLTSSFPRHKTDWWQQAILSIYSNMDLKKFDITVIAPSAPGAKSSETIQGIKVKRFTYFYPASMQMLTSGEGVLYTSGKKKIMGKIQVVTFVISELVLAIRTLMIGDYDIIHANWILPQGLIAIIIKFIFRKPVIVTVHGTDIFALNRLNFLKKFILRYCDICTTNSSATYQAAEKIYPAAKLKIVYMGVEVNQFDPKKRDMIWRNQYGKKPKIIMGVGRLIKWKGFEYLIKSFPAVLAKFPEAKLIILGKGPEEENLKKLAKQLDLKNDYNIFFPEHFAADKFPSIYASCDLVVSPSITIEATGEKEGMGNVALEARASGTAIIASRSGGLVDTIDGETNGLLFEEKNYKELAKKIIEVFSDDNLRKSLAENGLKHVRKNFTWKRTANQFEEIYEKLTS